MRSNAKWLFAAFGSVGLVLFAAPASAQEPLPPPPPPAWAAAGPPPVHQAKADGPRLRGGVSAGAGGMFISDYSGVLGGVDGRIGVQINDLIGVYGVPHLSLGPVTVGGGGTTVSTLIGVSSGTAVVDFTLLDRLFVGAGGGFGVVNRPTGPVLHFRAGGYPIMGRGEDGPRRKGLMVGVDSRVYFLSGLSVMELTGGIGYEAF